MFISYSLRVCISVYVAPAFRRASGCIHSASLKAGATGTNGYFLNSLCHRDGRGCLRFRRAICREHFDDRVVVRHAARVQAACGNEDVHLWPVTLETPRLDPIDLYASVERAAIVREDDGVPIFYTQMLRVFPRHEDVVAHRAV